MSNFHLLAPASARWALAAVTVVFTGCDSPTGPGQDAADEMLFLSTRVSASHDAAWNNTDRGIFRADAQASTATELTAAPGRYRSVSISADGGTVAYMTECNTARVMNADGSNGREVAAFDPFRCIHRPRISPDGTLLAMTSSRILPNEPGGWRIWVISTNGGDAVEVSSSLGTNAWMWGWSPDGRVVFHMASVGVAGTELTAYIVNPDGSNLEPVFARAGDHSPSWSPDGSQVAFISDRDGSTRVYVMNADGTNVRAVSDVPGDASLTNPIDLYVNAVSPWSPDGTRIAFTTRVNNLPGPMYSVRADGTGLTTLADASLFARDFNGWSHSGRWIAFTSGNTLNLYVADADGSNPRNLTTGGWQDGHALWLPRR
jgi:Tol biopolymer transport system component